MRKPSENDYEIELEGVGKFVYGQRTIGDFINIRRRYLDLAQDSTDGFLTTLASIAAVHEYMCVSCPDGWEDLMALPLTGSDDILSKVLLLDRAIGEKENSFRKDAKD